MDFFNNLFEWRDKYAVLVAHLEANEGKEPAVSLEVHLMDRAPSIKEILEQAAEMALQPSLPA
jgi:hypothetical protein